MLGLVQLCRRKWFIMALTFCRLAFFSFVLFSAEGLRNPRGVAGDVLPPPYPVVNVHVPEPVASEDDLKSAATANQHRQDSLLKLEEGLSFVEKQTLATMTTLAQEVKHVADLLGSGMAA